MLKKEAIEKLAKLSKLTPEDLTKAITDTAEVDVTIQDDLQVFTTAEITTRDQNQKTIGVNEKKEEHVTQGKELAVKAFKTKFGITDDSKDPEVIATKAIEKLGTGDAALKEQVTLLTKDKTAAERKAEKLQQQLVEKETISKRLGLLPKNVNTDALNAVEHVELVNRNLEFTTEGVKMNGTILRNGTDQTPLSEQAAIEHFYKTVRPALLKTEEAKPGGGRGGGNEGGTGGAMKTLKDVQVSWKEANPGKSLAGIEFQEHLQQVITDNKGELDFNVSLD